MKKNIYAIAHAAAVVLLMLAGCDTITMPETGQNADGKAAVSLAVAGEGARTVLPALNPDLSDVKAWKLLGAKTGETQTPLTDLFTDPATQTLYLETGDWDFTLKGYKDEPGGTLILEGVIPKQAVILGGPNVLEFTVAPLAEGTGTVEITINLPVDHGITQVKVFKDSEELDPIAPVSNSVVYTKTDHEAGDYYYRFLLYKGEDLYGTVSELVQVRANLTSKKTYTLGLTDLNIRYAITYEMDGGGFAEDKDSYHYYQYTDADFTLPTPTRGDYDFLCWCAKEFPDIPVAVIPAGSTGTKTFRAEWYHTGDSLTSTAAIGDYLVKTSAGGNSADNPVILPPVNINLADGGWAALLTAIYTAGKYAALDLSDCTMSGTEFDPGSANTGEKFIVSLVLPEVAVSVKDGGYSNSLFKNFSALKSVVGENIESIGEYAFHGCTSLTEVKIPKAGIIGGSAFEECTALTTLDLPKATTIGEHAFQRCAKLETIDLPMAETIGKEAFRDCISLTEVKISKAETILNDTFSGCTSLTSFTGNNIKTVNGYVFYNCTSLTTVDLPNATTIGGGGFPIWGVFDKCTALKTVNIPNAEYIGTYTFPNTGAEDLTVILGSTVPLLGGSLFHEVSVPKAVTVQVPSVAADWNGKTGTFTGAAKEEGGPHWGDGFRGRGWNGSANNDNTINTNISLTIETY